MGEYSAKIDFQTVVTCKNALEIYKSSSESSIKIGL